jgi:hypothetical protein
MKLLLISIIGALSERFLYIKVALFKLSFGDLFLVLTTLFLLLITPKIHKLYLYLAIFGFSVVFMSIVSNNLFYGFNSLISIPLKLLFVGLCYGLIVTSNSRSRNYTVFLISILMLCLIFITGLPPFGVELFNRNELASYLISLVFLLFVVSLLQGYSNNLPFISSILTILFLIFLFVESRQAILSLMGVLAIYILFSSTSILYKLTIILTLAVTLVVSYQSLNSERGKARISSIVNMSPETRADNFRLSNLIFVIENYDSSPLFGHGPTSFVRESPYNKVVHNTYFSTYYEYGVFGIIFLFTILYILLRPMIFFFRNRVKFPRKHRGELFFLSIFPISFILQINFIESFGKMPIYIFILSAHLLLVQQKRMVEK